MTNPFYIELIDRDNNRAVVETIYGFETRQDATDYALNVCNTTYANRANIVYRICER